MPKTKNQLAQKILNQKTLNLFMSIILKTILVVSTMLLVSMTMFLMSATE